MNEKSVSESHSTLPNVHTYSWSKSNTRQVSSSTSDTIPATINPSGSIRSIITVNRIISSGKSICSTDQAEELGEFPAEHKAFNLPFITYRSV